MKRTIYILAASIALAAAVLSCRDGGRRHTKVIDEEEVSSVEESLEQMRSDTSLIKWLDTLSAVVLGPEARCLSPVKHTFAYDGRTWVYNQDWGGVLEIPQDYIVIDDMWQALVSYHGSAIISPDSLVRISYYEGFECFSEEEFRENTRHTFDEEPFVTVVSFQDTVTEFGSGYRSPTILMETMTDAGVKGYFRYIYKDTRDVEHSISIQFPQEMEPHLKDVIGMVSRYPFGPDGGDPMGVNTMQ